MNTQSECMLQKVKSGDHGGRKKGYSLGVQCSKRGDCYCSTVQYPCTYVLVTVQYYSRYDQRNKRSAVQ